MRVHHLNCGTMRPPTAPLVCHVLLIETSNGLVLVDTGYGLADLADPRRLGAVRHLLRPALDPEETAAHQVERLGYRRSDVRHILVTHFDADHVGGLADFPDATVHATAAEVTASAAPRTLLERNRYRSDRWAYGPRIVEHAPTGEAWEGFAAAKPLDAIDPGIVLVALPGHTRGHACVAVRTGDRWLLHAGDALFHRATLGGGTDGGGTGGGRPPAVLRAMERLVAHDVRQVRRNHDRLRALHRRADPGWTVISAHDPVTYAELAAGTT